MNRFSQEFNTLNYVIKKSDDILLFAHTRPDSDTVGSVLALQEYLLSLGKKADIACFDPFPEYLKSLVHENYFEFPAHLDLKKYKLIIACDAVERGFEKVRNEFSENQVIAIIDHHPYISMPADIKISETTASSVSEMLYDFFTHIDFPISKKMATFMLLGILYDTNMFQNSNTSPKTLSVASELMKKGAPLTKIVETLFTNKKICTLKLWGKAFEKARINHHNGMIVAAITLKDIEDCEANMDDVSQLSEILNTVPGTKFSLVLSEREGGIVKGSLRSEEYKKVDVAKIAAKFGGGGHKLASGFEIKGKIVETKEGWRII
ncbi:MAG: bifunctional oligoribonuclease/PAP phosphatase NrnA [Candidatus Moranbacteria bacterium]|nr:bifunctional oligoribonuclease/PAP phosphatase NrnA [Candidatus Moranbacteria bacterium]